MAFIKNNFRRKEFILLYSLQPIMKGTQSQTLEAETEAQNMELLILLFSMAHLANFVNTTQSQFLRLALPTKAIPSYYNNHWENAPSSVKFSNFEIFNMLSL